MRFSLQDVKKSIQRRGKELTVSLHFLQAGKLHDEIGQLIAYHERLLGQPQRHFALDEARACVSDYRIANCLIATLSNWYVWRQREWVEVLQEKKGLDVVADGDLTSAVQLRLSLYNYINECYQGFLNTEKREQALQVFADRYGLSVADLQYLLSVDSEEEAVLSRATSQPPHAQEVATLYNQWAFEAALCNASGVHFVIDCSAFSNPSAEGSLFGSQQTAIGVGTVIKRLCYLARLLGVYYDLSYASDRFSPFLELTLYGPEEVTGSPQQYGVRLARLCRLLLDYTVPKTEQAKAKKASRASLSRAIVEAEATVHFLQRAYKFVIDPHLLQLLPPASVNEGDKPSKSQPAALFDSSVEQAFSEAFSALKQSQGVDGWQLEREPEPLLLAQSIFIPDFALDRDQQRIYVEILGFWTPSYRERKIQKLQQLYGRRDLLLAIPAEARESFTSIIPAFPTIIYEGKLSVADVLQALRTHYDDFVERLAKIDVGEIHEQVLREGLLTEDICYAVLHCYRRTELQIAAARVVNETIAFVPGLGLYAYEWMARLKADFLLWMSSVQSIALSHLLQEMRKRWLQFTNCDEAVIETLLETWPEVNIRRNSIFDTMIEINGGGVSPSVASKEDNQGLVSEKGLKKQTRERRSVTKKSLVSEMTQADLWG